MLCACQLGKTILLSLEQNLQKLPILVVRLPPYTKHVSFVLRDTSLLLWPVYINDSQKKENELLDLPLLFFLLLIFYHSMVRTTFCCHSSPDLPLTIAMHYMSLHRESDHCISCCLSIDIVLSLSHSLELMWA